MNECRDETFRGVNIQVADGDVNDQRNGSNVAKKRKSAIIPSPNRPAACLFAVHATWKNDLVVQSDTTRFNDQCINTVSWTVF